MIENKMIINFDTVSPALVAGPGFTDKRRDERRRKKAGYYVGYNRINNLGQALENALRRTTELKDVGMKCRRGD